MKNFKPWLIGILVVGVAVIGLCGASWGVPRAINVQGKLVNRSTGSPVTTSTNIGFQVIDIDSGGAIWGPKTYSITPVEGIFNATIEGTDSTARSFPEFLGVGPYFLRITVAGEELSPDQQLVSVPFAITARNVYGDGRVSISGTLGTNAVSGTVNSSGYSGVLGRNNAAGGRGVSGYSPTGVGVWGSGATAGGSFESTSGYGLFARTTANKEGVHGEAPVFGVLGISTTPTYTIPWFFVPGAAVTGMGNGTVAVAGQSTQNIGVFGITTNSTYEGVRGVNMTTAGGGVGVRGESTSGHGVVGRAGGANMGVVGISSDIAAPTTLTRAGVYGESSTGFGIYGKSSASPGMFGGIYGSGGSTTYAVKGHTTATDQPAIIGLSKTTLALPSVNVEAAVYGESVGGYGLWAKGSSSKGGIVGTTKSITSWADVSDFGVYGRGLFGVVARGEPYGVGLVATGGNFGVTAGGVVGVKGGSTYEAGVGVQAENTGGGTALQVMAGGIQIASANQEFTAWPGGSEAYDLSGSGAGRIAMDEITKVFNTEFLTVPAGTITYPRPTYFNDNRAIRVNNKLITANSMIFLTSNIDECKVVEKVILAPRSTSNYFTVYITGIGDTLGDKVSNSRHTNCTKGKISFLIVN